MAKSKTPDGERVEVSLPFKLDDELKARRGETAAMLNKNLDEAVDKKKRDMAKHNEGIKKLTTQIGILLTSINQGVEHRRVSCVEVKNFEKNVIEWWFEGLVMDTRPMKSDDRQLKLQDKDDKKKKGEPRWQTLAPKFPERSTEEDKDIEIAKVHRLETSKKGASSSVDPK
jgi:hypothetical protein